MRTQFSLRGVFAILAMVAVLLATMLWLWDSSANRAFERIPPLFIPSIPMMGLGIALLPFVCLPAFVGLAVMLFKNRPVPYTAIVFVGLQFVGVAVDISYWGCGIRLVLAMLLALIAMVGEQCYRQSLKTYRWIFGLALAMTACWYIATICVAASASV